MGSLLLLYWHYLVINIINFLRVFLLKKEWSTWKFRNQKWQVLSLPPCSPFIASVQEWASEMPGEGSLHGHRAGLGVRMVHWLLFLTLHTGLTANSVESQFFPQRKTDSRDPSKQCITLLTVHDPHRMSACCEGQTTFPFCLNSPSSLNTLGEALTRHWCLSLAKHRPRKTWWCEWGKGASISQLTSAFHWPITAEKCWPVLFEIVPRPLFTPLNSELGFLALNSMGTTLEQIHSFRLDGDSENHPLYWLQGTITRHVVSPRCHLACFPRIMCNFRISCHRALYIVYERNEGNLPNWVKTVFGKLFVVSSQYLLPTPQGKPLFRCYKRNTPKKRAPLLSWETVFSVHGEC